MTFVSLWALYPNILAESKEFLINAQQFASTLYYQGELVRLACHPPQPAASLPRPTTQINPRRGDGVGRSTPCGARYLYLICTQDHSVFPCSASWGVCSWSAWVLHENHEAKVPTSVFRKTVFFSCFL